MIDWKEKKYGIPAYVKLIKDYARHMEYVLGLHPETRYRSVNATRAFGEFVLDRYGEIPETFTKTHVVDYMQHLTDRGISRSSLLWYLNKIRGFFRYLVMIGKNPDNPAENIRPKAHPPRTKDVATVEEITKLIDSFGDSNVYELRNAAIAETLYSTGMRVSELINIELHEYMPEQGCIRVKGKGGKERLTPIGRMAIEAVDRYLKKRWRFARQRKQQYLFLNHRGYKLTRAYIHQILTGASKIAGVKPINPHMLRRSCATHMLKNGASIRYVQEQLGHSSISTTMLYTKYTPEDLVDIYRRCWEGTDDDLYNGDTQDERLNIPVETQ